MAERVPCEWKGGHATYGHNDLPATVMVRETCANCDRFVIRRWCQECYDGMRGSGKKWLCRVCHGKMTAEQKVQHVVRIGDV